MRCLLAALACALLVAGCGDEDDYGHEAEQTVSHVEEAIGYYDEYGLDETIRYYDSVESVDGDLYLWLIDADGATVAHPLGEAIQRFLTWEPTTLDGVPVEDAVIAAAAADGGWVHYGNPHPITGEVMLKYTYVQPHSGLIFASGWYHPLNDAH